MRGRSGRKVPRNGRRCTNPVPGPLWTLAGRLRAASGGAMRRRATSGSLGCRERDLGVACAGRGFGVNPQELAGWDPHSKSWENAVYPGPKGLESFTFGGCQEVEWQGRGQAGWLLAGSGPSCLVHSSGALSRVWGVEVRRGLIMFHPIFSASAGSRVQFHVSVSFRSPRSTGITRWSRWSFAFPWTYLPVPGSVVGRGFGEPFRNQPQGHRVGYRV